MESAKHGNSESSSDENDQQTSDDTGTGRSYECTFCKRGFTNAQALGGHMNIHRKDKAKVKQVCQDSAVPNKSNQDYMASKYLAAPISSEQAQYYAALGPQVNYQMYFPVSNPSYRHAPRSEPSTALHEASRDANLSLQIGPPNMGDDRERKKNGKKSCKENEVDLELRLGHNP